MLAALPYPEKPEDDKRPELDQALQVQDWPVGLVRTRRSREIPEDAPSWWEGDEEASQAFLSATGAR